MSLFNGDIRCGSSWSSCRLFASPTVITLRAMHRVLKRVVERIAVVSGIPRLAMRLHRGRSLVLMYHNIVPDGGAVVGDRSLHLARSEFARQLDLLQDTCEIVSLDALVAGPSASGSRCRVAITFDDAYVGAVTLGVDELGRRGIPATIFVPPGLLAQETWWDRLGAASAAGLNEGVRSRLLQEYCGQGSAIQNSPHWHAVQSAAALRPEQRIADDTALSRAASRPGISIGSHTWSHPNLVAIDAETLDAEVGRSFRWLADRYTAFVPYMTYPYGLWSPHIEETVARAGFRAAFLASGGWLPSDITARRFSLPRFDVSAGLSLNGLRLRLAGFGLS